MYTTGDRTWDNARGRFNRKRTLVQPSIIVIIAVLLEMSSYMFYQCEI